jgi:hypothetical protein
VIFMKLKKCVLCVSFITAWLLIAVSIVTIGWATTWKGLLIPTMSPVFADMRTVQGALESLTQGLNPQVNNPGDPWGRVMNYPSIWIKIAQVLGLDNEANYLVFMLIVVIGFLYCCYCIILKSESVWALLCVLSGSVLLAVERGNNDLIVFVLLFSAKTTSFFRVFPIASAAALKIFPVLVLPVFIKDKKVFLILFSFCCVLFAWMLPELLLIRTGIPVSAGLSYGVASITAAAAMTPLKISQTWLTVIFVVVILISHIWKVKFFQFTNQSLDSQSEYWFLLGACTYVGTFLLSSNWNYRLIFLIMCIPYFILIKNEILKNTLLLCLFLSCNQLLLFNVLGYFGLAINILAKCTLFVLLSSMLLTLLESEIPLLKRTMSFFTTCMSTRNTNAL